MIDHIDMFFLGTSSGQATASRNQQAMAMQLLGELWLFDCGEAAQHRMARTTLTAPSITRIFISHMHGDHVYGLPGMLCNMAGAWNADTEDGARTERHEKVVIVGPQGIRSFLRAALGNSYCKLSPMKVEIHEIVGLDAIERQGMTPFCSVQRPLPFEIEVDPIEPDDDGIWRVPMEAGSLPISIEAVELDHSAPTVGWVLTEWPRPGKLDGKEVLPLLKEQGANLALLRTLKEGSPITLPDGRVLHPDEFVGPPTQRKLAILSDMRGPKNQTLFDAAVSRPTLMVHESTNACLQMDLQRTTPQLVERKARSHGHSTPQMAGRVASRVGAGHLILTHFSARYSADGSPVSIRVMDEFKKLAEWEYDSGHVTPAYDLMRARVHIDGSVECGPAQAPVDIAARNAERRAQQRKGHPGKSSQRQRQPRDDEW